MSKLRTTWKIGKLILIAVGALAIVLAAMTLTKKDNSEASTPKLTQNNQGDNYARLNNSRLIIAHRGASGYLPEHTFEAKVYAHALGADYIEQDVVLTKDNVPIVLHDIYIDDVTNVAEVFPGRMRRDGRFYAIDFTWAEIKNLRAHERTNANGEQVFPNRFPHQYAIFTLNTLEDEILLIKGLNKATGRNVGIYPEMKQPEFHASEGKSVVAVVVEMLKLYQYDLKRDKIYLQSFDLQSLKDARDEYGYQGKMIFLIEDGEESENLRTENAVAKYAKTVDGIGADINTLVVYDKENNTVTVSDFAKYLKANNLEIHSWTVRADALPEWADSVEQLQDILFNQVGVTGVFTDFPDISLKYAN